jgi:hypothetical protein
MDDQSLHALRRTPSAEFAAGLRGRLRAQGAPAGARGRAPATRWLAAAAAIAAVSFAFTFPTVRAGAAAFLDMFRVVSFVGVRFDAQRLAQLQNGGVELPSLFGQVELLTEPSAPVSYADPLEAGAAAGIQARLPTWLPPGWRLAETVVRADHSARVTANTAKVQAVLDALAIDDVRLPEGLDGQVATVHLPAMVGMTFRNDSNENLALRLLEARSAEVSFPAGFDVPALAQAGLRILGLDRDEAYRMANSIEWRNTLLVPVPADAASFRRVNVAGADGLMIERARGGRLLLWAAGGQMYALSAGMGEEQMLEIAQSLQ